MNYTVRNRDTLTSIAHRFDTTVADLAAANGLSNPQQLNHLKIGQQIHIPGDADEFTNSVTATTSNVTSPRARAASPQGPTNTDPAQPGFFKQLWNHPKQTVTDTYNRARGVPGTGDAALATGGQNATHVNTPWYLQTQGGHGFTPGKRQCFAAASAMARAGGGHVSAPGNRIEVATNKDRHGHLTTDPAAVARGRARIDAGLDAGHPVVVGLAHRGTRTRGNVDNGMTDHFVTITGRGTDDQGRAYYTFNDPGTRNGQDTNPRNRFYVDAQSGNLYRPADYTSVGLQSQRYEMTMVR